MSKGILANPRSLHFWALAAHHRRTHHHVTHATANVRAQLPVGAPPSMMGAPPKFVGMGGVSSSDRADRIKSLRESGYNPKNDFNANGTIKTQ
jgi:hypothetical protein